MNLCIPSRGGASCETSPLPKTRKPSHPRGLINEDAIEVMESPKFVGKEMALPSGLNIPNSHSLDAQGIRKDNDVASKTFGDLPTEIRLLIWNFCIPKGRMIKVKAWAYDRPTDRYRFRLEMEEDRSIPILFNICRETREIAQKTFLLGFNDIRDTKKLYWNPKSDIFYLNLRTLRIRNPNYSRIRTLHSTLIKVQNLGLRIGPGLWYSLTRGTCVDWLHGFPNLKHLRLIIEPREGCDPWDWANMTSFFDIPEEVIETGQILSPQPSFEEVSRPAYVQNAVVQKFERYRAENHPEWVPPTVEVYQMPDLESSSHYES